jgi:hypothetical protein
MLNVMFDSEQELPTSDRVRTNDRVNSREFTADIEWEATRGLIELELMVLGSLSEEWLGIGGSEIIQELLISRRESVIDLISRGAKDI